MRHAMPAPRAPLCPQSPFAVLLGHQDHGGTSRFPCVESRPFLEALGGGSREAGLARAVLGCRAAREAGHRLSCRCVRVHIRSVLGTCRTWFDVFTFETAPRQQLGTHLTLITTLTIQLTNTRGVHTPHACLSRHLLESPATWSHVAQSPAPVTAGHIHCPQAACLCPAVPLSLQKAPRAARCGCCNLDAGAPP